MRPAVFLDRDDTLIACNDLPPPPPPAAPGDLVDPANVRLLPGVAAAVAALRQSGFVLVVITNQGSVARGGATVGTVDAVNARLRSLLEAGCGRPDVLDAIYYCPFHPKGRVAAFSREHRWRKPGPGMILAAASELRLSLEQSWLVGDADRDVQAGMNAGLAGDRCLKIGRDTVYPDLAAATAFILSNPCPPPFDSKP